MFRTSDPFPDAAFNGISIAYADTHKYTTNKPLYIIYRKYDGLTQYIWLIFCRRYSNTICITVCICICSGNTCLYCLYSRDTIITTI